MNMMNINMINVYLDFHCLGLWIFNKVCCCCYI